ncbi:MAG TPA: ABC transporter substrate-binding protein [Desulfovibrio sp.]|uniref:Amino acid ABC transporter substrate-binding protein, PAAT family n=1 Tax=Nitratidesulfovibrio vulgaris (strain DP4) TaxID=391774 RepID=A0A0H3A744_NITV4|nr:amino acid ABC transporter substrate-binding protein, PAAT family [Nitratidesulfovibrio vulgaris DP4]HBW17327.1 ABC transporter substrate-binding protein [Desulfovibrio sp.]
MDTGGGQVKNCFRIGLLALMVSGLSVMGFGTDASRAESTSRPVIATADPWPPYADPAHPAHGLTLEILSLALGRSGYTVTMVYLPWVRAEQRLERGGADLLINCWRTEARAKRYLFSRPFARNRLLFMQRAGESFVFAGQESLKGKTVGTIRGYGYTDAFMADTSIRREEVTNFKDNVRKLVSGRVDLIIEDELVARTQLEQLPADLAGQVAFIEPPLVTNDLYVVAYPDNPGAQDIIRAFDAGLAAMIADGSYKALMERYDAAESRVDR